jgi:Tfp pilus assembly protein PilF
MQETEAEKLFTSGLNALAQGNTLTALTLFEKAVQRDRDMPISATSPLIAKAGTISAHDFALRKAKQGSRNPPLSQFKICLYAGKTDDAIRTFREGLSHEKTGDHQRTEQTDSQEAASDLGPEGAAQQIPGLS